MTSIVSSCGRRPHRSLLYVIVEEHLCTLAAHVLMTVRGKGKVMGGVPHVLADYRLLIQRVWSFVCGCASGGGGG
jgi:hypothetical protein